MAEINDIVSKQAIEGIKAADAALMAFDATMTKSLTELTKFTAELKKQGISYKDLATIAKAMSEEKKRANETEKQATKLLREAERAEKARVAALEKTIAKEKEHTSALKLEVKTVSDAIRQNKALTIERNKLDATTDAGKKKLQEYNAALTKNTEFIRQNGTAMEKQRMNIGNYASAFDGIGSKLAGAFSVTAVIAFGRAAFKAFEEQEQANRKLLFSLNGNKVAFKELTAQANDFQSRTGIADDAIQGIQTLAAESGKTTEDIKRITEATINWSKITGQDLQSAYLQINGTLTGTAGRLSKVDAEFKTLTEEQLKAGAAIDLINTKYANFAENAASDTEKLSANWGEFMESIGTGVAKIAVPALQGLNRALSVLGSGDFTFAEKFNIAITGNYALAKATMERKKAEDAATSSANNAAIRNAQSTKDLVARTVAERLAASAAITAEQNRKKAAEENAKTITRQIGEYEKLTSRISEAKNQINDLLAAGQQPTTELLTQLQKDEDQLIAVGKAAEFAALKLVAMQQGAVEATLTAKGITGVSSTAKTGGSRLKARKTTTTGAPEGTELFAPGEASQFAIEQAQVTSDTTFQIIADSANAELDLKLSNLEKEQEAKLKNAKLTEEQKAKIEADYQKKSSKLKQEQFKKQKAADIIQAIINTALSVTKLLGNPPAAIAAGIAGAAQIALITAQKIPQFDLGTMSTPDTFIAGERRPEWMIEPSGRVQLITKPTMFKGMAGATVIGGEQTKKMIEQGITPDQIDIRPEIQAMRADIVNTIRNKRELYISASGAKITERQGDYYKTYINRKVQWAGKKN